MRAKSIAVSTVLFLVLSIVVPAVFLSGPALADFVWNDSHGPQPGSGYSLAYDATNDILYRGTIGRGVWKYQGGAWSQAGTLSVTSGVRCLAYDEDHNVLYAGTYQQGVWRCNNPDTSPVWSSTSGGVSTYDIFALVYDGSGNHLYAGTYNDGVWRCDNPDTSPAWTDTASGLDGKWIFSLAYGTGHDVLYAGTNTNGTWICTSPATSPSWASIPGGIGGRVTSLAYDGPARNVLYAGTDLGNVQRCDTPDSAPSWTDIGGGVVHNPGCMVMDVGGNHLYVAIGATGVSRCDNPNTVHSWTGTGGPSADYYLLAVAYDAIHNVVFAGTYVNGVFGCTSPDTAPSWSEVGEGVSENTVTSVVYDGGGGVLYAAAYNRGVWRCDAPHTSPTWIDMASPGDMDEVYALAYDGAHDVLYMGTQDYVMGGGEVFRCDDPAGSPSWQDTSCSAMSGIRSLAYDSVRNILYAGTYGSGVRRCVTPDTAPSWANLASSPGYILSLAYDEANNKLYAGTTTGVYRCDNPDTAPAWSSMGGGLSGYVVRSLAYDGAHDLLYGGTDANGVWRCATPGSSPGWTDTAGALSGKKVLSLAYAGATDVLFAGTGGPGLTGEGVWRCSDPGTSPLWAATGGSVGTFSVQSLAYESGDNIVYAGTGGVGGWYATAVAVPQIASVNPISGIRGQTLDVEITGNDTNFAAGSDATFSNAGIDVHSTAFVSATKVRANITIAAGAALGPCTVNVITGGETPIPLTDGFTVNTAPPATHTVTASVSGGHGAVSPPTQEVADGGTATVNITPNDGYQTASITDNGSPAAVSNPYRITNVTNDHNVVVTFAAIEPPKSPTWYLAEGTTAWGFSTYITIENPNNEACTAGVTYNTSDGARNAPDVALSPMSQTTVNPEDVVPGQDFSTVVTCKEGRTIAVDRTMSWTGQGALSPEAHASVGVTSPQKTWYLPEGCSAFGFETWLLIQNPGTSDATATVTYMIEGEEAKTFEKEIPASSRKTFSMKDDIGEKNASIKVDSNVPVIPERAMYRNSRREGHDSIGTTTPATDYYLAEGTTAWGFTTYVLVQNPNKSATDVTITYMTPSGPKAQPTFQMPANSRKTIKVNDVEPGTDLSTKVHGSAPIICERAMYWGEGTDLGEACHDSIGMPSAHTTFYLPDGQTSEGRETWTLVQNPNDTDVQVEIAYMTPNGQGNVVFTETIAASSRKTFSMAAKGISGRASVMVTSKTTGKKIMCERAMYWNSRGAGTDTIGGYSN